jgi:hypothetical protein
MRLNDRRFKDSPSYRKRIPGQLVSAVDRVTQNGGIHYTEQRDIAYKERLCMSTRHNREISVAKHEN